MEFWRSTPVVRLKESELEKSQCRARESAIRPLTLSLPLTFPPPHSDQDCMK